MDQASSALQSIGPLQSDLLTIKHTQDPATLFPSHGFGRGGVGHFLCTGHSRVGLQRLPQAASQPASLSVTARRRLANGTPAGSSMADDSSAAGGGGSRASASGGTSLSGFSLISSNPVSIGATRAWEAGGVQHTHNFVSSSRTVRPQDVPKASKWAAVSFFENDPKEVARHMAIMDYVQAQHDASKAAERQAEQARHGMWAEQQREVFRRQRLEQAARYARSGIRPRSAYADLGAVAAAEAAHGVAGGAEGAGGGDDGGSSIGAFGGAEGAAAAATAAAYGGGGAGGGGGAVFGRAASAGGHPSYRDRGIGPTERFYTSEQVRSALSASGGSALYGTMNGRLRPATAGMTSQSGGLYERGGVGALSSNALGGAGGPPRLTYIPLPKKTYVNVHERMAAEVAEAPAARVAALAAAKARVEEERTQAVLAGELQELESFEARMRSLQRARSRAMRSERLRANGSGASEGEEERTRASDG